MANHAIAHEHSLEPPSATGIPHDKMGMWVFLCSSVMMVKALASVRDGDLRKLKLFLSLTLLFGATFLSIQAYEYRHLLHKGFNPHFSLFGSVFYTTTGFHGFHVFCGVVCMS